MRIVTTLTAWFFVVSWAAAADWPQFRGPNSIGSTSEAAPLKWDTSSFTWKVEMPGRGVSCPVVVGGRVYVTCATGHLQDRLHTLCLDAKTGKQLWHRQLWATGDTACHPDTSMAGPTPVADSTGVYALFATGDLAAYNTDGSLRFYRSLVGDYPTVTNQVGMAASPILHQGKLVVPMDNAGESFLVAIDTQTGKNLWKTERASEINWTTPLIRETKAGTEVLMSSRTSVVAYDFATGRQLWKYEAEGLSAIPSLAQNGLLLLVPGGGVTALEIRESGETPREVWKAPKLSMGHASPLFLDGRVYTASSAGVLVCADAKDGKILWQERLKGGGPFAASPIAAGGLIYTVNRKGQATVVKPGDKPEVVGGGDFGGEVMATPAFADGAIFVRTDKHVICIRK